MGKLMLKFNSCQKGKSIQLRIKIPTKIHSAKSGAK